MMEKEMKAAEAEAKTSTGCYVHKFSKPFVFQDKTYETLTFDWESLTGRDHLMIEREMAAMGLVTVTPEFSGEFLSRMAVRACREPLGLDAFDAMPIKEFKAIRGKARAFLL